MICGSRCLPHVPLRVLPKFIDHGYFADHTRSSASAKRNLPKASR
jgi:hypothetical protein